MVTYLYCRLFRDKDHKTLVAPGDRQRNRANRSAIGCPCRLKKVDNGLGPIQLIRNSKEGHNHEYSALAWKITSGIKALAGQEVSKGYSASQVANVLKIPQNGNLQALHLAGGEALRSQDVRNAGLQLLKANSDSRKRDMEEAVNHDIGAPVDDEIGAPARRKLEIRKILDSIMMKYNELDEDTKEWDPNLRDMAIREWIGILERITGPLRTGAIEDLTHHVLSRQGEPSRPMRGKE
ncbi:uncharacterized protein N7473_009306 [Penicillium subrubescens]|uniref:uncharacterized protein n=1 Tax=Penicillium subrubescens TaxID=1316194 RepID=UPI002544FE1A|nr:uncharacterized protein N7473_009306 [Penicillium subrubescens]KAJ5886632.1 hypothetical protein N7473_009306 [Penicillium subrubescens]